MTFMDNGLSSVHSSPIPRAAAKRILWNIASAHSLSSWGFSSSEMLLPRWFFSNNARKTKVLAENLIKVCLAGLFSL
ncbi:hypothetical protein D3C86_1763210 [compost metagenome]